MSGVRAVRKTATVVGPDTPAVGRCDPTWTSPPMTNSENSADRNSSVSCKPLGADMGVRARVCPYQGVTLGRGSHLCARFLHPGNGGSQAALSKQVYLRTEHTTFRFAELTRAPSRQGPGGGLQARGPPTAPQWPAGDLRRRSTVSSLCPRVCTAGVVVCGSFLGTLAPP